MSRVLVLVLLSASAFAAEVEVPLGARTPLKSKKTIHEVLVRDPSLLTVVVVDGAVSLEGKKSGVTSVTVTYEDGELERMLVIVAEGTNSKGPRLEHSVAVDLKQTANAQAKAAKPPEPKPKSRARAA